MSDLNQRPPGHPPGALSHASVRKNESKPAYRSYTELIAINPNALSIPCYQKRRLLSIPHSTFFAPFSGEQLIALLRTDVLY